MDGKNFFRFLALVLAIAAIAGIGYLAFNAGVSQGLSTQVASAAGQAGGSAYPHYGWPFWFGGFPLFGFGFLGLLFGFLLLMFVFRAITFAIWGPRWGHWRGMHGAWRHGWSDENGLPPMFKEWHDRAHGPSESGPKS